MKNKNEAIINNYINGNLSLCRQQLKKLNKKQLLGLLIEYQDQGPYLKPSILLRDLSI